MRQVHEEAALRDALERHIENEFARLDGRPARRFTRHCGVSSSADVAAGTTDAVPRASDAPRLAASQSPPSRRRSRCCAARARRSCSRLRSSSSSVSADWRRRIPSYVRGSEVEHNAALAELEDHDVSNQFTAMGSLKPGVVRLLTAIVVLIAIDYGSRHLYTRGGLARVRSIHFARWVFLDNRQRIVFFSNYDGSHESYMDDFVNKVGFGLNVVFSNGIGYPRTNWLILDGCSDERKFKEFNRRHQVPTQVWYKAYPGLTALDLDRNARIRQGLESASMSDDDAREWVALL